VKVGGRAPSLLSLLFAAACSGAPHVIADGGPPLVLELRSPAETGLKYGATAELRVRYQTDDGTQRAVPGSTVHFGIFGDPAGSTLSRDQATSDDDGQASVVLTAGRAEASFRVAVTAANAPEVDFDISVSKLDFVELDVQLAYPAATGLRALLYDDRACAALPPSPTASLPMPYLRVQVQTGNSGTLPFEALLSKSYAVVGRAEDASSHLVAYGCADVPAALIPSGSRSTLPLPLARALASPLGSYALVSILGMAPAQVDPILKPWQTFGDCAYGAAQSLLDAIEIAAPQLQSAIHDKRGTAVGGCYLSSTSLDHQLYDAMDAMTLSALPAVVDDLENIVGKPELSSLLTITAAGAGSYVAEHALTTLTLSTGTKADPPFDLAKWGGPIIDVKNVPLGYDGTTLSIGSHGFTVRMPPLWRKAFLDLSLPGQLPKLQPPTIANLVQTLVDSVTRPGLMRGCPSIDDLVCKAIGVTPGCLQTACSDATTAVIGALDQFNTTSGIDLLLTGQATVTDTKGNLQVDGLGSGIWSAPQLFSGNFTGTPK
jgi:hypothetical protein